MKNVGTKKLLWISIGILGILIFIVVILLVYNSIFGKVTYQDIENKVLAAAKKYYSSNSSLLPTSENQEVTTTDASLTAAGFLDSMSELTKKMDGVTCSAKVIVNYAGSDYRYTVLLDCGENYSTKTLSSYIEENESRVYDGSGLYDLNGELVYRGENPNNYVNFSNKKWRIVKITNQQIMLILDQKYERGVWDDRFNVDRDRSDGINDFAVSRIYEALVDGYQGTSFLTESDKKLLVSHAVYIGKRNENDNYNDGSIEKSVTVEGQYIGLLPLYDYFNASIDLNCSSAITPSCSNYNYLNYYDYTWWTSTADSTNTYRVFRVSSDGSVESSRAATNSYIRPVVYLASDILYRGGNGTEENPYIIK